MSLLSRRRDRRGANLMEFGLWLPALATLFSGVVDVSWMMSQYHNVVRAARDGARVGVAIIEDDETTRGEVITEAAEDHANDILTGVGMACGSGCTVDANVVAVSGTDMLVVQVTYPYEPLIGLIPLRTSMTSTFSMMLQQQT
jgi:Flp pilus assembly protein TadG